ncbi:hypothetical protein CN918_26750 [Priestia megaterium]|nr:hypothetical protein CN918_26750 [Priestia megaterium]
MNKRFPPDYEPANGIIAIPPPPNAPHYNVAAMLNYCKIHNKVLKELTIEERKLFLLPKVWRNLPVKENQKVIKLTSGWSLIIHNNCKLYSEFETETNRFLILDWNNNVLLTFEVEGEDFFCAHQSSGTCNYEANNKKRVITVHNEPDVEEDE